MRSGGGRRAAGALALLAALAAAPAQAGRIALQVDPACRYRDGRVEVTVAAVNRGDEPAEAVEVEARLGPSAAAAPLADRLVPGGTARATLALGAPPPSPGVHTIVVEARFTDVNGYPYSSLASVPLTTADVTGDAPLRVSAGILTMWNRGALRVTVARGADAPADARVRLVLPAGLVTDAPAQALPFGADRLDIPIARAGARHGSRHLALIVCDGEAGGRHWSAVQPAAIRVERPTDPLVTHRRLGWAAVGALLAAFAGCQFPRRRAAASRLLAGANSGRP